MGKLYCRRAVYIFIQYLISHTFSPTVYTVTYYVAKKEEINHFQYKYIFCDQDHICRISNSCYNYTTRKLLSRTKIAYMRRQGRLFILIIWMTVAPTQNDAQLFHLSVTIFWHNPTAPRCTCLILARFLQLSLQKLGFWITLAVELVTLQMLCHWPNNNNVVYRKRRKN